MKRLWMIVSTLCIANVLAIGGLVGWLQMSGRLNRARLDSVRAMLSTTFEQEQQARAESEAAAAAEKQRAADEARMAAPPESAALRIENQLLEAEKQLQLVLRQKQELASLREGLFRQLDDIDRREKQLASQRAAFEAERRRIIETEGTQQFKIALSALESQKPKDARMVLKALLDARQVEQVVAYLSRMDETKRSKILAEFVKEDATVAADLLERLRTRGLTPPSASSLPGSTPIAAAPAAFHDPGSAHSP